MCTVCLNLHVLSFDHNKLLKGLKTTTSGKVLKTLLTAEMYKWDEHTRSTLYRTLCTGHTETQTKADSVSASLMISVPTENRR